MSFLNRLVPQHSATPCASSTADDRPTAHSLDDAGIAAKAEFSRRTFLASLSAGSLVLMMRSASGQISKPDNADLESFSPDLFVSIAPSGQVTILASRSEMGTGIKTMLPRVVADELDADWERVTIHQAPGDKRLGDQNTDGSNSIRNFFDRMRTAGATARTLLAQAAAQKWNVPVDEVSADKHRMIHGDKSADFGELISIARTLPIPAAETLKFKPKSAWRYIGKDTAPVDQDKVLTGKAIYGTDARMEGQLFAIIARPPVFGGRVKSFDAQEVKKMPGVIDVIEIPAPQGAPVFQPLGGIAVLARTTWQAMQGRDALKIEWDHGANAEYDTRDYAQTLAATARQPGKVVRKAGDATQLLKAAGDRKITADYSVPHLAHAPMEVPCAVASVKTDASGKAISCDILAATQNPQATQQAVAPMIGMKPEDVSVEVTLLGSAFGRKSKPDYAVEAAYLSMKSGYPVHVAFTRSDDVQHDFYHTMSAMHLEAATDAQGRPTAWLMRSVYPPISSLFDPSARTPFNWESEQGLADVPFDIPNIQCEVGEAQAHVRIGWLRSVSHIQQNFATSSFADELAHHAGQDPKSFLLELIGPDRKLDFTGVDYPNGGAAYDKYPYDTARLKGVLNRVTELANWERAKDLPKGTGLGLAVARSFLSYAAHIVEVNVTQEGQLQVSKVWVVLDCGTVVAPDRVHAQMEGTIAMALGQAKYGKITFQQGACEQSNYDDYRMVTLKDYPSEVVVQFLKNDHPPAGVGESTTPSFAPALCNAIFAATGKRIRDLPIADHDLSWS